MLITVWNKHSYAEFLLELWLHFRPRLSAALWVCAAFKRMDQICWCQQAFPAVRVLLCSEVRVQTFLFWGQEGISCSHDYTENSPHMAPKRENKPLPCNPLPPEAARLCTFGYSSQLTRRQTELNNNRAIEIPSPFFYSWNVMPC